MSQHTSVQLFSNNEFELTIEYIIDTFRAYGPHLAAQLAFAGARDLVRTLDDDEKVLVRQGGASLTMPDQEVWWVTEPGFFRAISQRQANRIKDAATREKVRRFQRWVFHEVLPAIRKHGRYDVDEPECYTWDQFAQILYQRYGVSLSVPQVTNALRAAGVLGQKGQPLKKYRDWFWFTGSAVNVVNFAVPRVAVKVTETRMKLLERLRWHQMQLELGGLVSAEVE